MTGADARIIPHLTGLTPDHPAMQAATAELLEDLRREPRLRAQQEDTAAMDGAKGGMAEVVISLATSGSLASIARILHLWLGRDRRRSLTVDIHDGPDGKAISVEGDKISVDVLADAIRASTMSTYKENQSPKL